MTKGEKIRQVAELTRGKRMVNDPTSTTSSAAMESCYGGNSRLWGGMQSVVVVLDSLTFLPGYLGAWNKWRGSSQSVGYAVSKGYNWSVLQSKGTAYSGKKARK